MHALFSGMTRHMMILIKGLGIIIVMRGLVGIKMVNRKYTQGYMIGDFV